MLGDIPLGCPYIYPFNVIADDSFDIDTWINKYKTEAALFAYESHNALYKSDPDMPFKYCIWDIFGADTKGDILEFWNLVYIERDRDRTEYLPRWGDDIPKYIACVNLKHPYIHPIDTPNNTYYLIKRVDVDPSVPLWRYSTSREDLDNPNWVVKRKKLWDKERFCSTCEHNGFLEFCTRCKHLQPGTEDMFKHKKGD